MQYKSTDWLLYGWIFFGDYSQTDCNFNFNINVNVTVDIYINSSFNFSFSQLLNDLLSFRIMKLGSTSNITAKCETICFFFFIILLFIFERQLWREANIFFNCFCLPLITQFAFPLIYIS